MLVHYSDHLSLRDARRIYFETNRFGEDGGYGAKWVDFKLGRIPFPIPNTPGRVRAVRYHDLHHVLTGYDTTTVGELEISAWEVAAGCKSFAAAWALNLSGMVAGALVAPVRVFRAFKRGRRSRTLYGEVFEPLLDLTVQEARGRYVAPDRTQPPHVGDVLGFALWLVVGLVVSLPLAAVVIPLVPVGLIVGKALRRES